MRTSENPILYRERILAARRPFWRRLAELLAYPALVGLPLLSGHSDHQLTVLMVLAMHFSYFCGRSLFSTVSAVARERQKETLEALMTAGFPPLDWARTVLLLAIRPRLLELMVFGTCTCLAVGDFGIWLFTLVCIPFYALVGLALSVYSRRVATAQLGGILFLAFTFFVMPVADAITSELIFHGSSLHFSVYFSPWLMAGMRVFNRAEFPQCAEAASIGHLLFCLPLAWFSLRRLARPSTQARSARRAPVLLRFLLPRVAHPLFYRGLVSYSRNHSLLGPLRFLLLPAMVLLPLVFLTVLSGSHRGAEGGFYLALMAQMFYLTLRAAASGSQGVAEEREFRTWEPLLSARISLNQMVLGQWGSRIAPILAEYALTVPCWFVYSHAIGGLVIARACLYVFVWTAFVGTGSLLLSALASNSAQALRLAGGLVFGLSILTICVDLVAHTRQPVLCQLSPLFGLSMALSGYEWGKCLASLAFYLVSVPGCLLMLRHQLARREYRHLS